MLLSVQELLTRQRTRLVNALRGHAAEFGLVAPARPQGVWGKLRAESGAADAGDGPGGGRNRRSSCSGGRSIGWRLRLAR